MKLNPKYIALIIVIILLCFLSWCSGRDGVKPTVVVAIEKPDTITPKIDKNHADLKVIADSVPIYQSMLKAAVYRKNYYKQKYRSVYDSVYSASDSVCKSYLGLVNRVKQKQDSAHEAENEANSQLIINAFNQIGEYQDNEILYEQKIKQDSNRIVQLRDTILPQTAKAEFKRGKKVGRKQGVIGTVIAGAVLFVGVKSVIP